MQVIPEKIHASGPHRENACRPDGEGEQCTSSSISYFGGDFAHSQHNYSMTASITSGPHNPNRRLPHRPTDYQPRSQALSTWIWPLGWVGGVACTPPSKQIYKNILPT